jgi:small subunit ribosomal protein S13
MARIAGVVFPKRKLVVIGLTRIFGIGRSSAETIMQTAGLPSHKRCSELTTSEIRTLRRLVEGDQETPGYQSEGDLRRLLEKNVKRLQDIRCFRGRRHRVGLPVRGQRTRTNARTRRRNRAKSKREKGKRST